MPFADFRATIGACGYGSLRSQGRLLRGGYAFNPSASILLIPLRVENLASADPGRERLHVAEGLELGGQEIVRQHREVGELARFDRAARLFLANEFLLVEGDELQQQ